MQQVMRDGVALRYQDAGRGDPPLRLVHGWCCWRRRPPRHLPGRRPARGAPHGGAGAGRRRAATRYEHLEDGTAFRAACLVLADLVCQGWGIWTAADMIYLRPPAALPQAGETYDQAKQRLRQALLASRDRQLREAATQTFLQRMERPAATPNRRVSVLTLVDDGRALGAALRAVLALPAHEHEPALAALVQPVVEVCTPSATCPTTGLPLIDVWRYFRHTWSVSVQLYPLKARPRWLPRDRLGDRRVHARLRYGSLPAGRVD